MKLKLIDNANQWYKMASVWVATAWAALLTGWPMLTEEQRIAILTLLGIPPNFLGAVTGLAMLATFIGSRVTKQDALHKPEDGQ